MGLISTLKDSVKRRMGEVPGGPKTMPWRPSQSIPRPGAAPVPGTMPVAAKPPGTTGTMPPPRFPVDPATGQPLAAPTPRPPNSGKRFKDFFRMRAEEFGNPRNFTKQRL